MNPNRKSIHGSRNQRVEAEVVSFPSIPRNSRGESELLILTAVGSSGSEVMMPQRENFHLGTQQEFH